MRGGSISFENQKSTVGFMGSPHGRGGGGGGSPRKFEKSTETVRG